MSIDAETQQQQEEIFDSLPYYDNDLDVHPVLKKKVEAELARENRKNNTQTLHPKVPPPVELFQVSTSTVVYP
jgi:pre-mRNA-splicing factor SPF27